MKITVLDGYTLNPGDLSWDSFSQMGELSVYPRTPLEDDIIVQRIGDSEAVLTNKTPLASAILDRCPKLKYIGVLATGYNVVDVKAAARCGIPVCNIPTYGTAAVAQYVFALLLELCHHTAHHSEAVHSGRWENNADWCFWDYPLTELAGKTMGIIGFGRIGQRTAEIAKAFGMKVLAFDAYPCEAGRELAEYVPLERLLEASDVVSLHCPLLPETEGIMNRDTISRMKDGAMLINTSRGPLVAEQDLADALASAKLAGAALDVVSTEPIHGDNPLLKAPNCIITPHIAWAPRESRKRLMDIAAENLRQWMNGTPVNRIN
ncbi:MAG: D-2-hydroxyacid dehydrogenase [Oscillospiraceae bacterium]|jgi:glycerate dehydrogenase|nr:D-2-hydroxyacid dehydrogenase [Oscillospiraceae bacterium]